MSQSDIQRFLSDLKENQALLEEVKAGAVGLASLVELAQAKGYDISVGEARAYIRDQASQELTDEQLDAVAGGKGVHHRSRKEVHATVQESVAENVQVQTNILLSTDVEVMTVAIATVAIAGPIHTP